MIRMMIAAPASGSGKTAVTCGMLALLKRMNRRVCAFKCGPDYIDPMLHRSVLGVESHNLDLFLSDEEGVKEQYARYSAHHDAVICEGVMGYYDGVGGTTVQASPWHLADVLGMPVIIVMKPKGASLTLAAQIKGLCSLRQPHHIAGIILNQCTDMLFRSVAPVIERESGVPVLGYLPYMEEAAFQSRHLGLYTAGEIDRLAQRLDRIAEELEAGLDMERLMAACGGEEADGLCSIYEEDKAVPMADNLLPDGTEGKVSIAVARDEAFCFAYPETIDVLCRMGAKIEYFSPLRDDALPEGAKGVYLPGGYPELYAGELSENRAMRESVCSAVKGGIPTVAECGGFLYLGRELEGSDGRIYPMTGALPGSAEKKQRLVRFGYAEVTARKDSMLFRTGERIPVHEFHYWDSSDNGDALHAVKPVSGREWDFGFASETMYAGFPHLYFAGRDILARRFVEAAASYGNGLTKEPDVAASEDFPKATADIGDKPAERATAADGKSGGMSR